MVVQLSYDELDLRLKELDTELSGLGLPLKFRPMRCFNSIHGSVPDGDLRRQLFDSITAWFIKKYKEKALWDGVIGRIPALLRGELYLVRVLFSEKDTMIKFTDRFEDLPSEVASTFTLEEFDDLGRKVAGSTTCFLRLYSLIVDDTFLDEVERDLIWMALFDLENAANVLKMSGDTRNSIFHTHAAAEKFLKVALKRSGSTRTLKSFGHDLPKIFEALIKPQPRYAWLKKSVDFLQASAPNMEIRYRMLPRTISEAISAFNAALAVCGTLAQIWMFDIERGTENSSFVPGCFYLDGSRSTFYCKEIIDHVGRKQQAVLVLFRIDSITGHSMIVEMLKGLDQSAMFLEVKDSALISNLRQRYETQMRNPGRRVEPEELGIKITSGAEGSYVTGSYRIRVDKMPPT